MAFEDHKNMPVEKTAAGSSPSDPTPPTVKSEPEAPQVSEEGVVEVDPVVEAEVSSE